MSNFIVWCPTQGNPKVRHETKQKAETEAKRLAAANPGSEFYVAELKSVSATATVQTRSL